MAILLDFDKTIDGKDFFIKHYLYDDYTVINAVLEEKYQLTYDFSPVENPGFEEIDYSRIQRIQEDILYYSEKSRQIVSRETHVLKVEPLLEFIQTTAPRFMNDYPYYLR